MRFEPLMAVAGPIVYDVSIEGACQKCEWVLETLKSLDTVIPTYADDAPQRVRGSDLKWWDLYWSIQAKLHWHIIMFINLADACPCPRCTCSSAIFELQRQESRLKARYMIQNMLDNMPEVYEDEAVIGSSNSDNSFVSGILPCGVDVYRMTGYLTLILALHISTPEQHRRARAERDRIGQRYGVGTARKEVRYLSLPPILTRGCS